jgi:hypothetical protein
MRQPASSVTIDALRKQPGKRLGKIFENLPKRQIFSSACRANTYTGSVRYDFVKQVWY